jgi:hypothetical protein
MQSYKSNSCQKPNVSSLNTNSTPISSKIQNSFTNKELLNFISSGIKQKINFTSAFDSEGSQFFLKSKNIALQEILIEDNISEFEVEKKSDIINNKINDFILERKKKKKKNYRSCKYLTPENSVIYRDAQNEKTKSNKNNMKKENKRRYTNHNIFNFKVIDIHDELKSIKNKKSKKSFKTHELKMFKDSEIKAIEPIKLTHQNKKKENDYYFVKNNNEENDVSLFDMISQL